MTAQAVRALRGATCFSGIGAPEMGLPSIDWIWHAEIEPFPSAVMQTRHPESVNLGNVLADDFIERAKAMGPLDILAGGPPCQAFSVAGNRGGMSDARGNLTLRWVQILHAIQPRNAITENVPGWLSMPDNAFGCFLGALVGADDALRSPLDGKWPGVGMASGPRARVAWRILDAQYFGVAQRRRRVFVVADFGDGADPCEILFERQGVFGNFAPSREARERTAPTLAARTKGGGGLGTDFDCDGGLVCADLAPTLNAHFGDKQGLEDQHINGGGDCSLPAVAMCLNHGAQQRLDPTFETLIPTNRCDFDVSVFDPNQITSKANRSTPTLELCHTLPAASNAPVAFRSSGNCGAWAVRRLTPVECARLQGFPDDYLDITYRGKPAADGNKYKALGNSWAVPVGAWILNRAARAINETEQR